MTEIVNLPAVPVMGVKAVGGASGVSQAMDIVEKKLGYKLTGRKCYGLSTQGKSGLDYFACVGILKGDAPTVLGLEASEIPAGKYVKDRIRPWDFRKDVPLLIAKFEQMAKEYKADNKRPSVEFYRREDDLILYFPIK